MLAGELQIEGARGEMGELRFWTREREQLGDVLSSPGIRWMLDALALAAMAAAASTQGRRPAERAGPVTVAIRPSAQWLCFFFSGI